MSDHTITMTAAQADAVAALARLYMTTATLTVSQTATDWVLAQTHKWSWAIDPHGRVAGEGPLDEVAS